MRASSPMRGVTVLRKGFMAGVASLPSRGCLGGGLVVGLLAWASGPANAAGYALKEQSGRLLGSAFAGATAEAGDVSYSFFNPAALARQSGSQATVLGTAIRPRFDPDNAQAQTGNGSAIGGGDGGADIAEDAYVPALYGMTSVTDDLKLGLAVNVPFGLATDYPDGWAGRYHARESELRSVNVNPMLAYQVTDWLALGGGPQAQYTRARLTNAIDFGTIAGVGQAARRDGAVALEGDDWGVGYSFGALVTPADGTRIGFGYRSRIQHDLEADADFSLDDAGVGRGIRAGRGTFRDTGAQAALTTPATASLGVFQKVAPAWAVMGEVQLTTWSDFDTLRVRFDNPSQPDAVTEQNWDDSWFAAAGVRYAPSRTWRLRAGLAYDQSPIPDATRTPRIPGGDRTWLSVGASYAPTSGIALQAGYARIFVEDTAVRLDASDPGNSARGDLRVDYGNAIDLLSFQATVRF